MPKTVTYSIIDREDGRFDLIAVIAGQSVHARQGLLSRAEVDEALDMLRDLMAAIGAPLVQFEASEETHQGLSDGNSVLNGVRLGIKAKGGY